ncbi:hypothetical protein DFJ73DRAFT_800679 [Zopfochytrium polystomum]|nr:hypothetical protein DFJ73DRAFT_800679 [Zopfochytrium polystomum]
MRRGDGQKPGLYIPNTPNYPADYRGSASASRTTSRWADGGHGAQAAQPLTSCPHPQQQPARSGFPQAVATTAGGNLVYLAAPQPRPIADGAGRPWWSVFLRRRLGCSIRVAGAAPVMFVMGQAPPAAVAAPVAVPAVAVKIEEKDPAETTTKAAPSAPVKKQSSGIAAAAPATASTSGGPKPKRTRVAPLPAVVAASVSASLPTTTTATGDKNLTPPTTPMGAPPASPKGHAVAQGLGFVVDRDGGQRRTGGGGRWRLAVVPPVLVEKDVSNRRRTASPKKDYPTLSFCSPLQNPNRLPPPPLNQLPQPRTRKKEKTRPSQMPARRGAVTQCISCYELGHGGGSICVQPPTADGCPHCPEDVKNWASDGSGLEVPGRTSRRRRRSRRWRRVKRRRRRTAEGDGDGEEVEDGGGVAAGGGWGNREEVELEEGEIEEGEMAIRGVADARAWPGVSRGGVSQDLLLRSKTKKKTRSMEQNIVQTPTTTTVPQPVIASPPRLQLQPAPFAASPVPLLQQQQMPYYLPPQPHFLQARPSPIMMTARVPPAPSPQLQPQLVRLTHGGLVLAQPPPGAVQYHCQQPHLFPQYPQFSPFPIYAAAPAAGQANPASDTATATATATGAPSPVATSTASLISPSAVFALSPPPPAPSSKEAKKGKKKTPTPVAPLAALKEAVAPTPGPSPTPAAANKKRGPPKCPHGRRRTQCIHCFELGHGGGSICVHRRRRDGCPYCPEDVKRLGVGRRRIRGPRTFAAPPPPKPAVAPLKRRKRRVRVVVDGVERLVPAGGRNPFALDALLRGKAEEGVKVEAGEGPAVKMEVDGPVGAGGEASDSSSAAATAETAAETAAAVTSTLESLSAADATADNVASASVRPTTPLPTIPTAPPPSATTQGTSLSTPAPRAEPLEDLPTPRMEEVLLDDGDFDDGGSGGRDEETFEGSPTPELGPVAVEGEADVEMNVA